jgi:hypothetical protein
MTVATADNTANSKKIGIAMYHAMQTTRSIRLGRPIRPQRTIAAFRDFFVVARSSLAASSSPLYDLTFFRSLSCRFLRGFVRAINRSSATRRFCNSFMAGPNVQPTAWFRYHASPFIAAFDNALTRDGLERAYRAATA